MLSGSAGADRPRGQGLGAMDELTMTLNRMASDFAASLIMGA